MKKFSIVHIPPLSFFSKDLYTDVAMNWRGVNFLYLFLLLVICWVPRMFQLDKFFSRLVETELPPVISQVPEISITDGEVSIKEPQPYSIKNPKGDKVLAIIDTTGKINSLEKNGPYCLLTKNALIIRKSEVETRTYSLSQIKNFVLTSDRLTTWIRIFKKVFVAAIYPIAVFSSFITRIIQALIYAAIGLLFASWCRITLTYKSLIRMAVVAVTPCIIIKTVIASAGVQLPWANLIYLLLALAYLFFGVKATAEEITKQQEIQPPEQPGAV